MARYAPAQPCLSAYIPVYMTTLPEAMQTAEKLYDERSLWWQLKRLSLLVCVDEERFATPVREGLAALEVRFAEEATATEAAARELILAGKREEATATLAALTARCTDELYAFAKTEAERLADTIREMGGLYGRQKEAIEGYMAYAEIPLA